MLTTIITSLIRSRSGAKVATLTKQVADINNTLTSHGQSIGEHTTRLDEVDDHLGNLETRINETNPNLRTRDERMTKIENDIAEDRAERARRREEQFKSDLALTTTLTEMGTNLKYLKERIEEQTHARRR